MKGSGTSPKRGDEEGRRHAPVPSISFSLVQPEVNATDSTKNERSPARGDYSRVVASNGEASSPGAAAVRHEGEGEGEEEWLRDFQANRRSITSTRSPALMNGYVGAELEADAGVSRRGVVGGEGATTSLMRTAVQQGEDEDTWGDHTPLRPTMGRSDKVGVGIVPGSLEYSVCRRIALP